MTLLEYEQQAIPVQQWCAILRAFDADTLYAVSGATLAELQLLVAQGWLRTIEGTPTRYELLPAERQAMLRRLREERPRDEIAMHARALHHYAQRLRLLSGRSAHPEDEHELVYHLGALHDLFIEYMEWDAILVHTSMLRAMGLNRPRVERWIELCEAYTDLRAGHVVESGARIERLLEAVDLEPELRLRALHAYHLVYIYQSRYDQALALLNRARPLARALGDSARRSYLLLSIGQIYNDLYDHRRALVLSKLSLRLAQASGALYRELHAQYEVGSNAMQLGLWDEALAALNAAEEAYRRLGMTRRLSMPLWAKGLIYQINGENERCAATLTEGLMSAREENSHNVLATMDILSHLGLLAQTQGDDARALAYYTEAIEHAQQYGIRHWPPILQARMAGILARLGRAEEAEALWRQSVDAVEALRSSIDIETIRVSLFGTTQYIYESFVLFLLESGKVEQAFAYVERARSRAFLDLLARQALDDPATHVDDSASPGLLPEQLLSLRTATLAELQRQLGRDEVVLEYFTTGVRPRGEHWLNKIPEHNHALREAVLPRPTTLLFIITRNHVRVKRLSDGPSGPAGAGAAARDLDPNKLQPSALSDDPVLDMLRLDVRISWLSQRLLAPARRWLKSYRQIYIIPHGPLHYVPFPALRRPDGAYLLTAGGPAISFAPSATVLLHTLRNERPSQSNHSITIGYNGQGRARLQHAEQEAIAIAQHIGAEAWVGPAAKSAALLAERRQMRWLHIAGHALFDRRRAHTAALLLGEGDVLSASALLRLQEKRWRAELVTLSSCMSGFSSISAGDELFGLQRAFLYAIAPSIVCTLAKARDRVALLVMDQFYSRLMATAETERARPAAALRDALIAVRTMRRDEVNKRLAHYGYPPLPAGGSPSDVPFARPEYWAHFILIGRP